MTSRQPRPRHWRLEPALCSGPVVPPRRHPSLPPRKTDCPRQQSSARPWRRTQPQLEFCLLEGAIGRGQQIPRQRGRQARPYPAGGSGQKAMHLRRAATGIPSGRTRHTGGGSPCRPPCFLAPVRGHPASTGKGPGPRSRGWPVHRFHCPLPPWPPASARRVSRPPVGLRHLFCSPWTVHSGRTRGWGHPLLRPCQWCGRKCPVRQLPPCGRGHRLGGFRHPSATTPHVRPGFPGQMSQQPRPVRHRPLFPAGGWSPFQWRRGRV